MSRAIDRVIMKHIYPNLFPICEDAFKESFSLFLSQIQSGEIEKDEKNDALYQIEEMIREIAYLRMKKWFEKEILFCSLHEIYNSPAGNALQDILFEIQENMDYEDAYNRSSAGKIFRKELAELIQKGLADSEGELLQFNEV